MQSILDTIREYLGNPNFYHVMSGSSSSNPTWDYGSMLEYAICGTLLIVVVSNVFKLIRGFFK